jgi:N-acetylglucosaminyldiphosphoundecaprenol N-acetyl-beta-D-mannosaminyltransferase
MNQADLVTPDGIPLVWGLKLLGARDATRVYGPDLTPAILEMAAARGIRVGFYGGAPQVLGCLVAVVRRRFPNVEVAYSCSPPFRPLSRAEDEQVVAEINRSGAGILFIGLSTPKQDHWMAAHKGRVQCVMVGVGAAFDFLAGAKRQAPRWMMRIGMEWFFRLLTEPRRLWKRYLKHNPRFVVLFALQLLGLKNFDPAPLSRS